VSDYAHPQDLDADTLMCRTVAHQWDEFTPINKRPPSFGWRMSFRCLRCGAERHDIYDSFGDVASRQYVYGPSWVKLDKEVRRHDLRVNLHSRRRVLARRSKRKKVVA